MPTGINTIFPNANVTAMCKYFCASHGEANHYKIEQVCSLKSVGNVWNKNNLAKQLFKKTTHPHTLTLTRNQSCSPMSSYRTWKTQVSLKGRAHRPPWPTPCAHQLERPARASALRHSPSPATTSCQGHLVLRVSRPWCFPVR